MRPIGFSTGALAKNDFAKAFKMLEGKNTTAIELSALRIKELEPLVDALPSLDLSPYTHVSIHAPSNYNSSQEELVIELLKTIPSSYKIVIHPDTISNYTLYRGFSNLVIENMDSRKTLGRTTSELLKIFRLLPKAKLCFDIGHARQVCQDMSIGSTILRDFSSKVELIHMSTVYKSGAHAPLSYSTISSFRLLSSLIGAETPIILESPVPEEDINDEIIKAKSALALP